MESLIQILKRTKAKLKKDCVVFRENSDFVGYSYSVFFAFSSFLVFWPGFFSNDSFSQINQAMSGYYSTWHPPIIAWLMRHLYSIFGVGGLLLFNQLLYWLGIWKFLTLTRQRSIILLILVGFFPPIYTLTLHVWKDASLMVFILWAVNFFLLFNRTNKMLYFILFLFVSMVCVLTRINGFIPVFVLIFFAFMSLFKGSRFKVLSKSLICSVAIIVLSFILNSAFNKVIEAKKENPLPSLLLWDIVGTANEAQIKIDQPYYSRTPNQDPNFDWQDKYDPVSCNLCWKGVNCNFSDNHNNELIKDWIKIIINNPLAYLKHRVELASYLYGIRPFKQYYPYHNFRQAQSRGKEFSPSYLGLNAEKLVHRIDNFLIKIHLYQYPVYFLIALFVAGFSLLNIAQKKRNYLIPLMLALSGMVSAVSLFFVSVAADYRYISISIFLAILSLLTFASLCIKKSAKPS